MTTALNTTLQETITQIERLCNGLEWFIDKYPEHETSSDDRELINSKKIISRLKEIIDSNSCTIETIDGKKLGTMTQPPVMKIKEIVSGYFGHDYDDDMSDAAMAVYACQDLLVWLMANGWKQVDASVVPEKKISTNLEKAIDLLVDVSTGMHDSNPTRQYYFNNSAAMKVDQWWQNYLNTTHTNAQETVKSAIDLLKKELK